MKTIEIEWDDIQSIDLQTVDGGPIVTYRLHKKTISRWFSFGRFHHHHYNHYAIDQRELFEIVSEAFNKHGKNPGQTRNSDESGRLPESS